MCVVEFSFPSVFKPLKLYNIYILQYLYPVQQQDCPKFHNWAKYTQKWLLVTFTIVLHAVMACANLQNKICKERKKCARAGLNSEPYVPDCRNAEKQTSWTASPIGRCHVTVPCIINRNWRAQDFCLFRFVRSQNRISATSFYLLQPLPGLNLNVDANIAPQIGSVYHQKLFEMHLCLKF